MEDGEFRFECACILKWAVDRADEGEDDIEDAEGEDADSRPLDAGDALACGGDDGDASDRMS